MSQSRFIMVTDKAVYNYQKKSIYFLILLKRNKKINNLKLKIYLFILKINQQKQKQKIIKTNQKT